MHHDGALLPTLSAWIATCVSSHCDRGCSCGGVPSWFNGAVAESVVRTGAAYLPRSVSMNIVDYIVGHGLQMLRANGDVNFVRAGCCQAALVAISRANIPHAIPQQQIGSLSCANKRLTATGDSSVEAGGGAPTAQPTSPSAPVEQEVSYANRKRRRKNPTHQNETASDDEQLRYLIEHASSIGEISRPTMAILAAHYTTHPQLALLYYHCCATNPDARVYNDEHLMQGEEISAASASVVERLRSALDRPPDIEEIARCQESNACSDPRWADIRFCASCCELLVTGVSDAVHRVSVEELPESFRVTPAEREQRYGRIAPDVLERHVQVWCSPSGDLYYLNPDLVRDPSAIALCGKCAADPRAYEYSIASGHDYGRPGKLPSLNDVELSCVAPVRRFGLELSLSGQHATGHVICFPTDGAVQCSRVVPNVDESFRVTFIGSSEQWRTRKQHFRKLYRVQAEAVVQWLGVLAQLHSYYAQNNITVDLSPRARAGLAELQRRVEENVVIENSDAVRRMAEASMGDRFDDDVHRVDRRESSSAGSGGDERAQAEATVTADEPCIVSERSAVLRTSWLGDGNAGGAGVELVRAVAAALELSGAERVNDPADASPVVPITRDSRPLCEWDENGALLAGAFPTLFMRGGEHLPSGSAPKEFVRHLMRYYDGRFERNVAFVTVLFNQMQRHAAVQSAVKAGTTRGKALARFGELAASEAFGLALRFALDNPTSPAAKRLNARLLRLVSIVGGSVSFSVFERSQSQPKLAAMTSKYGPALFWLTVAPPEHDDLLLHRVAQIRLRREWNAPGSALACGGGRFKWADLPEEVRDSPRARLGIASELPALTAYAFEARFLAMQRDVFRCMGSSSTRISRNYMEREPGALSRIAAFNAVIETQQNGRLHAHVKAYGSSWSPSILRRVVCHPELREKARLWLDSVCCTSLMPEVHDTHRREPSSSNSNNGRSSSSDGGGGGGGGASQQALDRPRRACEVELPDARQNLYAYERAVQQTLLTTNMHVHSHTCTKGKRGKHMCRLARPAGVHPGPTSPLHVQEVAAGDLNEGRRGILVGSEVPLDVMAALDSGYNLEEEILLPPHTCGPVLWELHRAESDGMFVETNLTLAGLTASHTNATVITCEDASHAIEEYQNKYMTKEAGGLKNAAAIMLSALTQLKQYGSQAEDSNTRERQGKCLATKTVNGFAGGQEWSLQLMVFALLGHRSFLSSDSFWYVFPHDLMRYAAEKKKEKEKQNEKEGVAAPAQVPTTHCGGLAEVDSAANSNESDGEPMNDDEDAEPEPVVGVDAVLDECVQLAAEDEQIGTTRCSGSARMYKTNGKVVFLSQAESYANRGPNFEAFSPVEFECIVDIRPRAETNSVTAPQRAGRPKKRGFDLGADHPLTKDFQGFILAKFRTPMLGGAPAPTYRSAAKSESKMRALASYLLTTFTPWSLESGVPQFELNGQGLKAFMKQFDCSTASFLWKQRCWTVRNILKSGHRSSANERIDLAWRNRSADIWKELKCERGEGSSAASVRHSELNDADVDMEAAGRLAVSSSQLMHLLRAASSGKSELSAANESLRELFWSVVGCTGNEHAAPSIDDTRKYDLRRYIYTHEQLTASVHQSRGGFEESVRECSFSQVARSVRTLSAVESSMADDSASQSASATIDTVHAGGSSGPSVEPDAAPFISPTCVTQEQYEVLSCIIGSLDEHGPAYQTLTMMHGGGGTGKTFVIRRIEAEMNMRGLSVVNLCPTGAGASQLQHGLTFHSAFRVCGGIKREMSLGTLASMRLTFHEKVGLIVCDEVSMLGAELLVLMDERLRAIYDSSRPFGGKSILLVGDFLQLEVVSGTSLCKAMYTTEVSGDKGERIVKARDLFRRFRVCTLTQQLRAFDCELQQSNLESCRALPSKMPTGSRWQKESLKEYQPIDDNVVASITRPISVSDLELDPHWLDDMRILVTSNVDKAVLTACVAAWFARRRDSVAVKWKKQIKDEIDPALESLLFDELLRPNLFGYFVPDAPAQILDNANGNLAWGVGNGSSCKLHSLAWDDQSKTDEVARLLAAAQRRNREVVEIPFPPDYINVVLQDADFGIRCGKNWPAEANLAEPPEDNSKPSPIVIPIGLVQSKESKYKVTLDDGSEGGKCSVRYAQHAVDMATVMTVWKSQGLTLRRVLLLLEGAPTAPKWRFEHLYVAMSRVRSIEHLRCLPLSVHFRQDRLRTLRPNINTIKWLMNIKESKYWQPPR